MKKLKTLSLILLLMSFVMFTTAVILQNIDYLNVSQASQYIITSIGVFIIGAIIYREVWQYEDTYNNIDNTEVEQAEIVIRPVEEKEEFHFTPLTVEEMKGVIVNE